MKFKQYVDSLNKLIEKHPEYADKEVVRETTWDSVDTIYTTNTVTPTVGFLDDFQFSPHPLRSGVPVQRVVKV